MIESGLPAKPNAGSWPRDTLVGILILVAVLVVKLPGLLCPIELGLDESQLMVQAMRYERDIVPWRSVDGTSGGPISSWFLLAAHRVGMPLTYPAVRVLGLGMVAGVIIASYLTLRLVVPFAVALLAAIVGVVTIDGAVEWDFMQLTTEQLPAFALSLSALACVWVARRRPSAWQWLAVAGVLVGLVPWTKLQGAPGAAVMSAILLWQAWRTPESAGRRTTRQKLLAPACVMAALLLPSVIILGIVWAGGALEEFWRSYVVANASYTGSLKVDEVLGKTTNLFLRRDVSGLLVAVYLLLLVAGLLRILLGAPPAESKDRTLPWIATLSGGTAFFCTVRPDTDFPHYQFWLLGPVLLALGWLLHFSLASAKASPRPAVARGWLIVVAACGIAPIARHAAKMSHAWSVSRSRIADFAQTAATSPQRLVTGAIHATAPQARTMAIWGWMPSLYLESGLACATRHAIGHFLIDPSPSREFLRGTFLADLASARPDIIVDAVASGCFNWNWDPKKEGLESFPALAAFVKDHYVLVAKPSMDLTGVPLRIFLRRDLQGAVAPMPVKTKSD